MLKLPSPKSPPIILCCAYRAPDLSFTDTEKLCTEIYEIKSKFKNSLFWLCGDFNVPDINWTSNTITSHQYPLEINKLFLDLTNDLGLTQTVYSPTRNDNILDLFFTNNNNFTKNTSVISGTSDHQAVLFESNISFKPKKPIKRTILLWSKADIDNLKKEASEFCKSFKSSFQNEKSADINSMWLTIKQNLLKLLENNVPTKTSSSKYYHPWINQQIKRLIRNKNPWYQKVLLFRKE